jgi:hypothetical protein
VIATRVSTGALVASATPTDGRFRFRLKRGIYDVTAMVPGPPPCPPDAICPAASPTVVVLPCEMGETKRVGVKRRRFTHVALHIRNVCIV